MSRWYEIKNQAGQNEAAAADVYLYDEIGGYGIDAQSFIAELKEVETDILNVHINSVGGEVYQGFAIYQALKDHPATVNITVDALAASIASVIAMAGDKVIMARNSEMMIHDGHVMVVGNAAELTKTVALLDRVSNNIASVYAERSGVGTVDQWRDTMRAETWYSAEEAVEAGLADEVAPAAKRGARNSADLRVFNYAGRAFAPAPVIATPVITPEHIEEPAPFEWDTDLIRAALKEAFENE
jgi:ATP-dependent protease ClpP protease subunit